MQKVIDTTSKETLSIDSAKKRVPHISWGNNFNVTDLIRFGYAPIIEVPAPVGDVVEETTPVKEEDGKWYQTWSARDYSEEEKDDLLNQLVVTKLKEIEKAKDEELNLGISYVIAGTPDVIQTRPKDKVNLLGLRIEAQSLKDSGVEEAVIPFRGLYNVPKMLTPQEMIDLTNVALNHIQEVYKKSWLLKDHITQSTDKTDIEAVQW